MQRLSSIVAGDQHGENSPYFHGWKAYDKDPFHPLKNPHGVIQMGLAENQLCFDMIQEWVLKTPRASICSGEGIDAFKSIALFQDYHGLPKFRNAIAKFMSKMRGGRVSFDPDRIIIAGGATGANEMIMFCLADPGDAFLVPTPYYPGFDRDLRWRTGVKLIPVPCTSSNNFQITAQSLEQAYQKALNSSTRIKGVILTNPSNPLGTTLTAETLKILINFINAKQIHLVCDEIYAATVFRRPDFISVLEIIQEMQCDLDLIHIVYSLSKDLGIPGFRVGIVYSYNDRVVTCARKMSSFGLVSSQTQYLLAEMLSDDEFVMNLMAESRRRLRFRHENFVKGIEEIGIGCVESNAGLFCWMDLRKLMSTASFAGELELWRVILNDVKLNVSPGSAFHCDEPGWFRVCFANMDDETIAIALGRIKAFVKKGESEKVSPPVNNLHLSFSPRLFDDAAALSPRVISPRSQMVGES